jgi:hypothetical protein
MANPTKDETYSEEETERRREATLKVMLATPKKQRPQARKAGKGRA